MTAPRRAGRRSRSGTPGSSRALVVQLPCCPSPVALPVLFRLWRGKGTASQVAARRSDAGSPGGGVPGPGGARHRGRRLPRRVPGHQGHHLDHPAAVQCGDLTARSRRPPGKRGRPREKGDRIGTCAEAAAIRGLARTRPSRIYGKEQKVQAAACARACGTAASSPPPGQLVLMREPDSKKPYDLGIFTLDTSLCPGSGASSGTPGGGPSSPPTPPASSSPAPATPATAPPKAVERTVPFAFLDPVPDDHLVRHLLRPRRRRRATRRQRCPWYRTKATPSPADMHAALRDALTDARINRHQPRSPTDPAKITSSIIDQRARSRLTRKHERLR